MNLAGLSARVNRVIAWADRLQRRHGVLGFPYAVVKKYGDDGGGREAALITYYGFLSLFPLLLLGVAVLSRVLASNPDLRARFIAAVVPEALQSTVEHALAALPTSPIPLVAGLIGLVFSGTGVVFSVYETLHHVAAVPHRLRAPFVSRYVRLLVVRPAPIQALWPGALIGAAVVTLVLNAGAPLLARLVTKAGPVYGSFATAAGLFALLYLVGQALVYAAEVAAVRYARLWPRAVDVNRPTEADVRVLAMLAREQERIPAARVEFHLAALASPPAPGDSPPAGDSPG